MRKSVCAGGKVFSGSCWIWNAASCPRKERGPEGTEEVRFDDDNNNGGPGRSSRKIAGCENSPLEELKEKKVTGEDGEKVSEWETTDDEWPASKIF